MQFDVVATATLSDMKSLDDFIDTLRSAGFSDEKKIEVDVHRMQVSYSDRLPPARAGILLNIFESVEHHISLHSNPSE